MSLDLTMTQSPVVQNMAPNMEFMEHYIDSLENLPLDVQRFISQIREYDLLYKNKLEDMGRYLRLYQNEPSGLTKRKYLNKIQKCLIKSQHYGDMKLNLISQIVEMVDSRSQQLNKDVETMSCDRKEEETKVVTNNNNHVNSRVKVEKTSKAVAEKLTKSIPEKPKRIRRVRTADKSTIEKNDRVANNHSRTSNKADEDEEEEPMEEEEPDEPEVKPKKETKKTKEREAKHKEKEREKERSTKEDKEEKEEKKVERKDKHTSGKVIKKSNNKVQTKMKKQKKKKEKEVLPEDIPIDPDEPTYCLCKRISYGDMIGCDNESCDIEWFHFDCVNLTHKPKGKWYCPRCTTERKEKNKK